MIVITHGYNNSKSSTFFNFRLLIKKHISHNAEMGLFSHWNRWKLIQCIYFQTRVDVHQPPPPIISLVLECILVQVILTKNKKINLTQLRRNTSSRPQKKSGKKAPRKAWEIMKWFVPQNQNCFYTLCQLVTSLRIVTIKVIKINCYNSLHDSLQHILTILCLYNRNPDQKQ